MGPSPGNPRVESKVPRVWCTGRRFAQAAPRSPAPGPLHLHWPGLAVVHSAPSPERLALPLSAWQQQWP